MKNKPRENGFVGIESLLLLFILIIIGFTGWFVFHSKSSTNKLLDGAAANATSQPNYNLKHKTQNEQNSVSVPKTIESPKNTSPATPKSAPKSPSVVHPTAEEVQLAILRLGSINSLVNVYWANTGFYPNELNASALVNQEGASGSSTADFTAPSGTSFHYSCTKGGQDENGQVQCAGYKLEVRKLNGAVIKSYSSNF